MGAQLSVRDVRQVLGGREVLRIDSLDVAAGERLCVLGPNGAGKTTLLRLLAAVTAPSSGEVTVAGVSSAHGGVELRRRVAYATQQPGLLTTSVRRNVELPLRWRRVPRQRRAEIAMAALERLRVAHLADRPARSLSGGEQQRVSLARALALDPEVLLLDEPAAGLDAQTRAAFFSDLDRALESRATTVVQVSHRAHEAFRLADRVVVLVDGLVHQVGPPEVLNRCPADASVAALVGYDNVVDAAVQADGAVCVGASPTGLTSRRGPGPVNVAAFANGIRIAGGGEIGLPMRVTRVTPGAGHWVVALDGAASLVAHVSTSAPAPVAGDAVTVSLDPDLSVVMPALGVAAADLARPGSLGGVG
jgi:ABC-type Fe3+/spermidine/putrescine transport system ATPase subunit